MPKIVEILSTTISHVDPIYSLFDRREIRSSRNVRAWRYGAFVALSNQSRPMIPDWRHTNNIPDSGIHPVHKTIDRYD